MPQWGMSLRWENYYLDCYLDQLTKVSFMAASKRLAVKMSIEF